MLPGSSATIEESATAVINSELAVLSYKSSGQTDPRPTDHYYKGSDLPEAALINNGTLELNSGFGGKVTTTAQKNSTAVLKTGSNYTNSVTSKQITSGSTTKDYTYSAIADFNGGSNQSLFKGSYISAPNTAYWQSVTATNSV